MSPEALPQQRLNEVVGLPPKPDGFDVSVEYVESLGKRYPKGYPDALYRPAPPLEVTVTEK
jgi:hypothetical protein